MRNGVSWEDRRARVERILCAVTRSLPWPPLRRADVDASALLYFPQRRIPDFRLGSPSRVGVSVRSYDAKHVKAAGIAY
jgi:hypothetical protein